MTGPRWGEVTVVVERTLGSQEVRMTRPAGAAIPRYWSPWRWVAGAQRRAVFQALAWGFTDLPAVLAYQGA